MNLFPVGLCCRTALTSKRVYLETQSAISSQLNNLTLQQLVEAGANVDSKGFFGGTGLHWAAMNGYQAVVKFLVSRGADVNLRDDQFGATTAGWANEGNQTEIRDWLLMNDCRASICEAAAFGRMDLVEGHTALHEAAGRGNENLAQLLLRHGANRETTDTNGLRPIDWARYKGQEALVKLLEKT